MHLIYYIGRYIVGATTYEGCNKVNRTWFCWPCVSTFMVWDVEGGSHKINRINVFSICTNYCW